MHARMLRLEAVTSALSFTAYLLAKHQDVQDKVRAEVKLLLQKDGNINYDNIFSLKYLNQVIQESLRFYPPLPGFVSRRCQKDFEFNGLRIPKGTNIQVPARLMHHDPRYWVDPEKFNPDRFSPENKPTIEPMAYIPFGIGPRSCPGSRLAEIELPLIMAKTVAKFKLHLSDEPEKAIHVCALDWAGVCVDLYCSEDKPNEQVTSRRSVEWQIR
ncbi:cytochrome P450 3A41-like [Ixodes scapularis]